VHKANSHRDTGTNVITGTGNLTGTALGGIISVAAESSGARRCFKVEPVTCGLRTIHGLEKLGKGIEAINGLSIGVVKQVSQLTIKAINTLFSSYLTCLTLRPCRPPLSSIQTQMVS
jgi:hypothetical protein